MHVFIWDSNSQGLVVCLILKGEEWPLIVYRTWMRLDDDFMYLDPIQLVIRFNSHKTRSWDYGELFHPNAEISHKSDLLL